MPWIPFKNVWKSYSHLKAWFQWPQFSVMYSYFLQLLQQNLRQGCNHLLELSSCKVGSWSIYTPDSIPHCGYWFPSSSEWLWNSQTSSSSQSLAGGSGAKQRKPCMLTAVVESWVHGIVSHVGWRQKWAMSLRSQYQRHCGVSCQLGLCVSQHRGCLPWPGTVLCTSCSTRCSEGGAVSIPHGNKFRMKQSYISQCFLFLLLSFLFLISLEILLVKSWATVERTLKVTWKFLGSSLISDWVALGRSKVSLSFDFEICELLSPQY